MTDVTQEHSDELFFASHNTSSPTTIVLLHGLFSSHLEWQHVIPYLSHYHLLVPDLPQHSRSRHLQPLTVALAAGKVAALIRGHAHGGRAHVVGLSFGGFTTMELIRRHPDVVESAFVTGSSPFSERQVWLAQRPSFVHWGMWLVMGSGIYQAAAWYAGFKAHEDLKREIAANNTFDLASNGFGDVCLWQEEQVKEVGLKNKRVLAAAGDQGDNVDDTKKMVQTFRELAASDEGKGSCAYVVKGAVHGWNLQFPELFANAIKAWIERRPLPEGFESLV